MKHYNKLQNKIYKNGTTVDLSVEFRKEIIQLYMLLKFYWTLN